MSDDITLTVRVRDMTRGEFSQIRQRMHGMDGDLRRIGHSTSGASNEAARMSQNLQGLTQRLDHLHSTGTGTRSEMTHMSRTMSLLGRQLRVVARDGGMTEDEFRSLSNQLDRTRLDFDHLARDINRHSSEANAAARAAAQQQRAITAQQTAAANQQYRNARRMAQAHTAALREESQRRAQIQRDESARLRQGVGGATGGTTLGAGGSDPSAVRRMASGLQGLQRTLQGISGSSADARHNIGLFNGDINAMSRILRDAQTSGSISRQSFDDLTNGLRLADRNMRTLRGSGDLTRGAFRGMRRDVAALQAQLRLLGGGGDRFDLFNSRLLLFRRNLRSTSASAGPLRRMFSRMGDWGLGGLMRSNSALSGLARGVRSLGTRFAATTRAMKIFMLVMLLIAPAAQALGAILVAVLGAAFVALGAFALKGNAEVKAAFQDMKSTVGSVVKEAALPMKDDLVSAMRNVGVAAREMQPTLTRAFTAVGPLVNNIFGAVTDFAGSALTGLTTALEHSEVAIAGFRKGMGLMGAGFGDMFAIITKGNEEELGRAWVVLGNEIRNVLESLGEFMSTALNSGTASMLVIGIFRTFTGALNIMAAALDTVDSVFGSLFTHIADGISGFTTGKNAMAEFYQNSGKSVKELKKDLADLDAEISKTKGDKNMPKGVKDDVLNGLQTQRVSILEAIASAEQDATAATLQHTKSVADLIKQIQALADLNRNYLDAQSAQEAAIDAAQEKQKDYANALKLTHGRLDLTNKAAQESYGLLSKVAQTTRETTDKAIEAKAPWDQVIASWQSGRTQLIALADGMGLNAKEAQNLATQILGIPPTKDIVLKARTEEAVANLDSVIAAFRSAPGEKVINVKALGQDAIALLQQIGFQVTQLPDGSFQITAETSNAETNIGRTQAARDALKGKNITLSADDFASGIAVAIKRAVDNLTDHKFSITATYRTVYETIGSAPKIAGSAADAIRRQAEHFSKHGASGGLASSLPTKKFASGGSISGRVLEGRGTKTSDSLTARLSRGEFVMQAAAVDKYGPAFMDSVNRGQYPGFAKGGSASAKAKAKAKATSAASAKAHKEAQADLRGQMTRSRFGAFAGQRFNPLEKGIGAPGDMSYLVNALNSLNGSIKRAFSGSKASGLLKQLDRSGKALIKYEKKLTDVNKRLDAAKDKLGDLKQAAAQLKESVTSGVLSATNITGAAGEDKNLTMADLMAKMTQGRDKASAFASSLKQLRSRGVSKDIINQISEAGISGGGLETAGAILAGSGSEISSLNLLQSQINASAKSAGQTASDAMYAAGIKAADGLVKGLTKQKKTIENAMMNIAKSMERAIKRALGIKSPSKVMEGVGHFTAEGFARGIERNPNISGAWESMLTAPSNVGASAAGTGGGGGGITVIQLHMGNKFLDEIILDSNRRTVRTKGGNVQAVYGRKTG